MTKILNFQNENEVHFQNSTMRKYTEREVKQERVAHNSDCKDSKSPRTSNRSNRSTKKATMATIRRLSDKDVRSIFESLHHSRPPPAHLKFQIIPVASNGLKLSPPSYEFEGELTILPFSFSLSL